MNLRYQLYQTEQNNRYERLVTAKAEYEAATKAYLESLPVPSEAEVAKHPRNNTESNKPRKGKV